MATKKLVTRVRAFQKRNKLKVDGDFGPQCMTAVEQLENDSEELAMAANNCAKDVMRLNKTVNNQIKTINKQKSDLLYWQNTANVQQTRIADLEKTKVVKSTPSLFDWFRSFFMK